MLMCLKENAAQAVSAVCFARPYRLFAVQVRGTFAHICMPEFPPDGGTGDVHPAKVNMKLSAHA